MRLLFHSPQFYPSIGGLQNVVQWWAEALSEMGHEVTVTTTTHGDDPPGTTYRVLRNPGFWTLTRAMRRADLVVMFNVSLKQLPQWILSGSPLFVSHHTAIRYDGQPMTRFAAFKHWVANRLAVGQCACSQYVAAPYRHCKVVPNPFRFPAQPEQTGGPRPKGSILFAGRLVKDKGVDLLLEAVAILAKSGGHPALRLTIAGDGPESPALQQQAAELGIGHLVHFAGSMTTEKVQQLMLRHEVLVVPSLMEPFGLVVLEGMAAGCKLVLSRQGGLPEAGDGFAQYFETGSVSGLTNALHHALLRNELPEESEMNARRQYLAAHSIPASAKSLEACLQACLRQSA